jgi:hypothetical protein
MKPEQKAWLNSQLDALINKKYTQEMTTEDRVKGGLSPLPVIGDAISGYDAYQSAKKGNYGEAALNAIGLLPLIPGLAGMIKFKNIDDVRKNLPDDAESFIRWSVGPKYDMKSGAVSRDFSTGQVHGGLSAVPIDNKMTDSELAKYLHEYSYARMGNDMTKSKGLDITGNIYSGKMVGLDSDGYASIIPEKHIGQLHRDLVKEMDSGLVERLDLQEKINDAVRRLDSGSIDPTGREIISQRLNKYREDLAKLLGK